MKRGRWEMEAWWIRGGKGEKKIHQWASPMGNRLADLGCGSLGVKLKRV